MTQRVLDTERLSLRPFAEGDAPFLFEMYSDAQTARYLSYPPFTDEGQAHAMVGRILEAQAEERTVDRVLVRKSDRVPVGSCTLFGWNKQCARAELGFSLDRRYWSQGYMNEALRGFIDYAFAALAMNRLEADIDPRNTGSAKTLERLGFAREGFLRERWIVAGEVSDTALYGLLRRDWPASGQAGPR
jgi:[ribosomal protein S5]-alanine N-acetyltransferase